MHPQAQPVLCGQQSLQCVLGWCLYNRSRSQAARDRRAPCHNVWLDKGAFPLRLCDIYPGMAYMLQVPLACGVLLQNIGCTYIVSR